MKNIKLLVTLFIFTSFFAKAQVKDISFTISPAAEYTWWDNKAGIEDGALIGGKLGFGFGEYIELRGVYMKTLDLKTSFKDFGLLNYDPTLFTTQNVNLTRWGGEVKANLGTHKLNPYATIGTGVQSIELDGGVNNLEQIYASLGLGIKFNIAKRMVFSLEAKNTTYRYNAGVNLLTDADKISFGVTDADFADEKLSNWSVLGSLQFYLGGRRPGTITALDEAYLKKFKGGFNGLQLIIEPSANFISFDNNSLFRDTYLLGGYAGIDFNEYIGIRGFYFQATENKQISTSFDNLALYGLEFRARLNDGNGVTPYLILGGGFLNSYDNYLGKGDVAVNGGGFASGGLGLNIPLSKNLLITGGARAILNSGENITNITGPNDIQTHIMYNAGLKLSLGKKSKDPKVIYEESLQNELNAQQSANNNKIKVLKEEYQTKISALENDIKVAYETKDVDKAVELLEEKKETQKALKEVEIVEDVNTKKQEEKVVDTKEQVVVPMQQPSNLIQLTPAEFESLIERILKGIDETPEIETIPEVNQLNEVPQNQPQFDVLNKRIEVLEKLLLESNSRKDLNIQQQKEETSAKNNQQVSNDASERIIEKLDELNRKIDSNASKIDSNKNKNQTVIITPTIEKEVDTVVTVINDEDVVVENQEITEGTKMFTYKNTSGFLGVNLGNITTANVGVRMHYAIRNTALEFMPEAYFGFGDSSIYGVSGNIIYPFSIKSEKIKPYVGVGVGFYNTNSNFKGNYNVIVGTKLPLLNKNIYIDYTMRNSFKYNQLGIGYHLPF